MLHDAVQGTDAGIANENRKSDDAKSKRQIPQFQAERFNRQAKNYGCNQDG